MRKLFFALVVAAAAILPWQAASAAPGQVTKADPQLMQTWWTNLAVGDGVRERDTVRIEHNGQTVGEALVVSVTADHSVVMLKGGHPGTPQVGDNVVFVKQAAAVPVTVANADTSKLGYKVVGGHSVLSFSPSPMQSTGVSAQPLDIGTDSFGNSGVQVESLQVSGLNMGSDLQITNNLNVSSPGFGDTLQINSSISVQSDWGL